jgi:hypothetical protein
MAGGTHVHPELCGEFRERVAEVPLSELAAEHDLSPTAVKYHVHGECDHGVGVPPRAYDEQRATWQVDRTRYCGSCGRTFDTALDLHFHQADAH